MFGNTKISLIVPCYNEGHHNLYNLKLFKNYFDNQPVSYEIIIVDDGSTKYCDILKQKAEELGCIYLYQEKNKGKGYAVKKGIENSTGEHILYVDIDNSTPIEHFSDLYKHRKTHEIVIGSRHITGSNIIIKQPLFRRFISYCARLIIGKLLLKRKIVDSQCGFKLIRNDVAKKIIKQQTIYRWGFDAEILLIAIENGYKIKEVPVSWNHGPISQLRSIPASFKTFLEVFKIKNNQLKGKYNLIS